MDDKVGVRLRIILLAVLGPMSTQRARICWYAATTFGTLMKANGEDIKTIQELLRHHPGSHLNQTCCTDEVGEHDSFAEPRGAVFAFPVRNQLAFFLCFERILSTTDRGSSRSDGNMSASEMLSSGRSMNKMGVTEVRSVQEFV